MMLRKLVLFLKTEKGQLTFIMLAIFFVHAFNMFGFPYYENDEGTYLSQAWSLLKLGKLAPYTYWYDHPPVGWMLLSLWSLISGGFFTFGASVNSGRVLMLVLHCLSSLLLYFIVKRISKSHIAALAGIILFSFSPLGLYFQRRVLLDNIMTFWFLLALALLYKKNLTIMICILSGIIFGLAVLTKENAVFFSPAFFYALFYRSDRSNRLFAFTSFCIFAFTCVSLYVLYAFLKLELLPSGTITRYEHVSLLGTLFSQLQRGTDSPFWNIKSDFFLSLLVWLSKDALLVIGGILATVCLFALSIKQKYLRPPLILTLGFWLFLIRGRLVIDFYVVPLIPLLALQIVLLTDYVISYFKKSSKVHAVVFSVLILCFMIYDFPRLLPFFLQKETEAQTKAIEWIKTNVNPSSSIAIDDYAYVDLHESRFEGDPIYNGADWVWKIELDPDIRDKKLHKDWRQIDYIMLTHEIVKQIRFNQFPLIKKALENSLSITSWKNDRTYVDLDKLLSANGDWVDIYRRRNADEARLAESWNYYKKNFIISYGQVIDPSQNGLTTSEGQAYVMLRAVYLNDKTTFDGVWKWTKDHFQHRIQDKLFSWKWNKVGKDYVLGDSENASDADVDIALALLFASKKWSNISYKKEALELIKDIWRQEVKQINGVYYLVSSVNSERNGAHLINISYFSPAHYRIFAEVDPDNDWLTLASDTYFFFNILHKSETFNKSQTYLPPNWLLVKIGSGDFMAANQYAGVEANDYGYDAFRIFPRIALDASWFHTYEATEYLKNVEPFFSKEWKQKKQFSAIYTLDGVAKTTYDSISTSVGPLAVFSITNPVAAKELFGTFFLKKYNRQGYWGEKNNYYDQNWAWFGDALFNNNLPNLWEKNTTVLLK